MIRIIIWLIVKTLLIKKTMTINNDQTIKFMAVIKNDNKSNNKNIRKSTNT